MRPARSVLIAISLIACAWFVVGLRQAHETNVATVLISEGNQSTADRAQAALLLKSASFMYPGQDVPILQARLAMEDRDFTRARAILEGVTRTEPQNLAAWVMVAALALVSPREASPSTVRAHIVALDPVDARSN